MHDFQREDRGTRVREHHRLSSTVQSSGARTRAAIGALQQPQSERSLREHVRDEELFGDNPAGFERTERVEHRRTVVFEPVLSAHVALERQQTVVINRAHV